MKEELLCTPGGVKKEQAHQPTASRESTLEEGRQVNIIVQRDGGVFLHFFNL